jgi:hypothetical protein
MPKFWLALLLVAACYQPTPSVGVPCGPLDACPMGQNCVARRCVIGTEAPDATADDASPDGSSLTDAGIDAASVTITWKSVVTANVLAPSGSINVPRPAYMPGDMFVATIAMGATSAVTMPAFTAPTGWVLVRRLDRGNASTLAVYYHKAKPGEPSSYTWQFSSQIEGVAWISCYSGVNLSFPIQTDMGAVIATATTTYATPSIATTTPNAMVVATFVSHAAAMSTWTAPTGTNTRASLNNGDTRSGLGVDGLFATAGPIGPLTATVSSTQDYALVDVLALAPQ